MSKIPYAFSNGGLSVEVVLSNAADVFLVDQNNYNKYINGQQFQYHGGHYNQSPVNIRVSGTGRYYLIVNGSSYKYRFY